MEYIVCDDTVVVRIKRGEEVISELEKLCEKLKITAATVEGIGAADKITVGLYNVEKKEYFKKTFEGDFEITSLMGNISTKDGKPYLHLHINFADENLSTFGGHLNECKICATAEIFIKSLPCKIKRFYDDETGLNLFLPKQ